jgi:2-succinyl-6-hydroxy-2,4-cyclohexadiene-1-carboxylate synthase
VSTATSLRVESGGLQLHVETRGQGTPVLLLHGFTGCAATLSGLARELTRAGYRTVAPDLVGHGGSDAPTDPSHYTMPRCVAQVRGVLDALDLRRVHAIGYSMGGRVALSLCAAHPERVRSALLVGASAGLRRADERRARRHGDEALAARIEREGVAAFVDDWMAQPLFASQLRRLSPEALAAARAQRLRNRAHGLAHSLRGMGTGAQPALHAQLPSIDVPVALVVGEEDAKFDAIAQELARRLPRARVARVPDAGHAAHLENPAAFLRVVLGFLADAEDRNRAPALPARQRRTPSP